MTVAAHGAGGAQGVGQRNGAAQRIDAGRAQAQLADHRPGLGRKGFVELDPVDLAQRQAGTLQRLGDGLARADAMMSGGTPLTEKDTNRARGVSLWVFSACSYATSRACAAGGLRAVAGGDAA